MSDINKYLKKWKNDKQVTVKLPQEVYDDLVDYLHYFRQIPFQEKTGISTLIRAIVCNFIDDVNKERK